MIAVLNLSIEAQSDGNLCVQEVDNAVYLDLCCQAGNVQGKRELPSHDVRYVGSRDIPRGDLRQAVADYLNGLLREGRVG